MSFWRKLRTAATSTLDTGAPLIGTVNARSFRFEDVCTTPAPNLASLARFACNLRRSARSVALPPAATISTG